MAARRMLPLSALALLLLTPPGTPAGGFHWQRIITPPPGAPMQQACVVLDAATFANTAPALNDLRLFQDGTELPYVIEESYDERALNSGVTPADDRSEYEAVTSGRLFTAAREVEMGLPAHVPVERIAVSALAHGESLSIHAIEPGTGAEESEQVSLSPERPYAPLTLGANLQHAARVLIAPQGPQEEQTIVLEMRRRSLCYQPRSASPLVLYLGGGQGTGAKVYGLANGFSTTAKRPYATLGPLEPNPDLQPRFRRSLMAVLLRTGALAGFFFFATLGFLGLLYGQRLKATGRLSATRRG